MDSDNDEDIVVSDSEDEAEEAAAKTAAAAELEAAESRISTLATTKVRQSLGIACMLLTVSTSDPHPC